MNADLKSHVDRIIVPHTAWQEGFKKVDMLCRNTSSIKASIVTIVGESGSGKTTFLNQISTMLPSSRDLAGLSQPTITVVTPSIPTEKALAGAMLDALGYTLSMGRMSEADRKRVVIDMIRQCTVKVIMIDEIQHFIEHRGEKSVRAAADWLKTLADQTKAIIVLSGLPQSLELLHYNEQLARRAIAPIMLPKFNWRDPKSRNEFCAVMDAFTQALKPFSVPDLGSEEMAFRFYSATNGMIGNVVKILKWASWAALERDDLAITLQDLEDSYSLTMFEESERNPFSAQSVNNGKSPHSMSVKSSSNKSGILDILNPTNKSISLEAS